MFNVCAHEYFVRSLFTVQVRATCCPNVGPEVRSTSFTASWAAVV